MAPGEGALSARTVLEVADGLRWSDPQLGLSLAEHALRLAGDDAGARAAAQRCVIRSLAEVDRFEEVVSRATPLLEDAAVRKDRDDLAGLLVELAVAAIGFGDDSGATRLVAPVGPDEDLPTRTTVLAALVRAQLAGATGDVAGADRAAQEADVALGRTAEPEAGLVRRDLARARAAARSRSGDPAAALTIVSGLVSADPGADPDGGRRSLLAAGDQVDRLVDLGRPDEALERGRAALPRSAAPPVVCPAARVRLALAERIHFARGAYGEAGSLARAAAEQLEDAGHDAAAARAWEVVASAAERGGELAAALTAVRHGHALEARSRDRRDPAVRALATLAASAPELPARPAPPPPPEPAPPEPAPAPDEGESPAAASGSLDEGPAAEVDTPTSPARPRSHRRRDADGASRTVGTESVPETLARLLGGSEAPPTPVTVAPVEHEDQAAGSRSGADGHGTNGLAAAGVGPSVSALPSPDRHDGAPRDDRLAELPAPEETDPGPSPSFDAFSTAPGSRTDDHGDSGRSGSWADSSPRRPVTSAADPAEGGRWDANEFPHIDPADPLGSRSSGEAGLPGHDVAVPERSTSSMDPPRLEAGPAVPSSPGQGIPGTSRDDDTHREAFSRGAAPGSSPRIPDDRDVGRDGPWSTPPVDARRAARYEPADADRGDYDDELALTRAGLLAEYQAPDAPEPPRRDDVRSPDVAVPSARGHVSGSMALSTTGQRFATGPNAVPERAAPAPDDAAITGRAPRGENGARLANLLAEAMDAFRHTGPEDGGRGPADPGRGNGDPGRSNGDRSNGDRGRGDAVRGRGDGTRGSGIGSRRR